MKLGSVKRKAEGIEKDMKGKMLKVTLPWLIVALVLPLMAITVFTAKPAEAG